jgi:hypothetical protein
MPPIESARKHAMALVRQPTLRTLILLPVLVGVMAASRNSAMQQVRLTEFGGHIAAILAMLVWLLPGFVAVRVRTLGKVAIVCFFAHLGAFVLFLFLLGPIRNYGGPVGLDPLSSMAIACGFPVWGVLNWHIFDHGERIVVLMALGAALFALVGVAFAWSGRLREPDEAQ